MSDKQDIWIPIVCVFGVVVMGTVLQFRTSASTVTSLPNRNNPDIFHNVFDGGARRRKSRSRRR